MKDVSTMTMEQLLAFHFPPKPADWQPPERPPQNAAIICPKCKRHLTGNLKAAWWYFSGCAACDYRAKNDLDGYTRKSDGTWLTDGDLDRDDEEEDEGDEDYD